MGPRQHTCAPAKIQCLMHDHCMHTPSLHACCDRCRRFPPGTAELALCDRTCAMPTHLFVFTWRELCCRLAPVLGVTEHPPCCCKLLGALVKGKQHTLGLRVGVLHCRQPGVGMESGPWGTEGFPSFSPFFLFEAGQLCMKPGSSARAEASAAGAGEPNQTRSTSMERSGPR